jgi:arsenate reductase
MKKTKSILFLCTGNSCRSQMAEGFARNMLPNNWLVYSAGTIAAGLHPLTIEVMKEVGVDISSQYSKTIDEIPIEDIDCVVTLCGDARDNCPVFPKDIAKEHWPIKDPIRDIGKPTVMESFRQARDEIKRRVEDLLTRLSTSPPL